MMVIATTALLASISASLNLPPGLLQAICTTESNLNPSTVHQDDGGEDSIGLCQLQLSTARDLGYKGPPDGLLAPRLNASLAGRLLRKQLDRYQGDEIKAVSAYNLGTYRENDRGLPVNDKYVIRVFSAWKREDQ